MTARPHGDWLFTGLGAWMCPLAIAWFLSLVLFSSDRLSAQDLSRDDLGESDRTKSAQTSNTVSTGEVPQSSHKEFLSASSEQYPEYHGGHTTSDESDRFQYGYSATGHSRDAASATGNYSYTSASGYAESPDDYGRYESKEDDAGPRYRAKYSDAGRYRQPVSMMVVDKKNILISTKLSGEILLVDVEKARVTQTFSEPNAQFGKILNLSDGVVAVVENQSSCVMLLQYDEPTSSIQKVGGLQASGQLTDLAWDSENRNLYASGKWSQRLYRWTLPTLFDLDPAKLATIQTTSADLPMCGGKILLLPQHQIVMVTDPFGRDYAMLSEELELLQHDRLYGHNVAALAATSDEQMVFFPHQLINEYAKSVTTDITWGGMLSNNIRWLRTERLLRESGEQIFRKGKFYPLGTPGNGAGDPSAMALSSSGRIAVALAGINRVAIGNEEDYYFRQLNVGFRPVDVAFSADDSQLFVLNQFSDSLSVVDLYPNQSTPDPLSPNQEAKGSESDHSETGSANSGTSTYQAQYPVQHIALGPLREPTRAERGEQLFFNARLSHDNWMSCHSCHSQGHTNGQLNDNFSDKTFGTPKRVLSLMGQAETRPYSWGGSIESVEDQVAHSVTSTMAGDPLDQESVDAIAAYIRTLPSPPSLFAARGETPGDLVGRGESIFREQGCASCHAGEQFTSPDTYDVGIYDEHKMRLFNPPSLIGVSQRSTALLHDGRARSIRDVFSMEKHQLESPLSDEDLDALVAYLQSL